MLARSRCTLSPTPVPCNNWLLSSGDQRWGGPTAVSLGTRDKYGHQKLKLCEHPTISLTGNPHNVGLANIISYGSSKCIGVTDQEMLEYQKLGVLNQLSCQSQPVGPAEEGSSCSPSSFACGGPCLEPEPSPLHCWLHSGVRIWGSWPGLRLPGCRP